MTDCIIIGSGPAGISTALTLQSLGKSFIMLGRSSLSDKIAKAEKIHNYPGLSDITGEAFVKALQNQLADANITIAEQRAMNVYALNGKFGIATQEGEYYEGKTVVFACGVESVKSIDGESQFLGRGVSYCATCDGFLYKDKTIAVLCTSKLLEHEIQHLAHFAKKVYLIPTYKPVEVSGENIQIVRKMPIAITGEERVKALKFATSPFENAENELAVDGVFMLRESVSPAVIMPTLQTEKGHIIVDREMKTNIDGCFAVGDCTGRPYQYAKAVGEGNVCAHSVSAYLSKNK